MPLTNLDRARGEGVHFFPQILPNGGLLYFSPAESYTGIYATSVAKPADRVPLLTAGSAVVYAPGGDGKNYLLWLRETTLVAQEFDSDGAKLKGEPRPVADPVGSVGISRRMNAAGFGHRSPGVRQRRRYEPIHLDRLHREILWRVGRARRVQRYVLA